MPNRILRDFTDSDRVNLLTAEAERLYVRLMMKADDFGRYFADPKRLKAFLFPLKDQIRETDISRWLAECEKAGLLRFYDATGKRFLELWNFGQRLRNMRKIHPVPESDSNSPRVAASCGNPPPETESETESESETETKERDKARSPEKFAEKPSWTEFWGYCQSLHCGLPAEFYARDKFEAAEADNWTGKTNWRAYARRCRGWWEADGRPMTPTTRRNGKQTAKADHEKGF